MSNEQEPDYGDDFSILTELRRRRVFRVIASYAFVGWLLVQIGETVFEPIGLPDWALPALIWVVACGFPVAILLAWALQITSDGVVYEKTWKNGSSPGSALGIAFVAGGVLVSVLVILLLLNPIDRLTRIHSIAVLPFQNLSNEPSGIIFAEGLAEELLSRLQKVEGLKVPGRRTTEMLVDKEASIANLGQALRVDAILEGGVRWRTVGDGDATVKVDLRLIKASDGYMIWSQEYERELDDIFVLQEDIATAVIRALRVDILEPLEDKRTPTSNIEAYEMYLRARASWHKREYSAMVQSIDYYKRAIELDPDYADAYSGLAEAWVLLAIWGYVDSTEPLRHAAQAAAKALELDADLPGTQVALGSIAHWYDWDHERAERHFLHAIELDSTYPTARNWYSIFLANTGRTRESLEQLQIALETDPANVIINSQVAYTYLHNGDFVKAVESANAALEKDPRYIPARYYLGWALQMNGQYAGAIRQYLRVAQPIPLFRQILAQAYAAAGRTEEVAEVVEELMETRERGEFYVPAYFMAVIYAQQGDVDAAFEWLETAIAERSVQLAKYDYDPYLLPLRSDPRFDLIRQKIADSAYRNGRGTAYSIS